MFKNRYFLIGLGFGFILCGIILIIFNSDYVSFKENKVDYTNDELKEMALERNLFLYTEEEINEIITKSNIIENIIPEDNNENKTIFTISYGLDSFEVAEYLYNIGVLEDKQMFQQILTDNNLTKKIIAGQYEIGDLTITELIELITNVEVES
ncbi:MAG: hypothetical protein AB7V16_02110 [Vulcanibacillus sp.]